MSIFSGSEGMNPLPWLQEKTLVALQGAARLVDLANEPDTTAWYSNELRRHAAGLIGTLAPLVVFAHQAGDEPANQGQWEPIVERGSFALAAWCKKYDIANPTEREFNLLAEERAAEEQEAKAATPDIGEDDGEPDEVMLTRRLMVTSSIARRMIHEELPEPARRVLLWAMSHLELGAGPDVVILSKRFLPTDVDITPQETAEAYRLLWEEGFIERVERSDLPDHALPLRWAGIPLGAEPRSGLTW
jgi:hypothetical protein